MFPSISEPSTSLEPLNSVDKHNTMSSLPEVTSVQDYTMVRFPALAEATAATESISPGSPEPPLPAYDDDGPPPKYQAVEELVVVEEEEGQERTAVAQRRRARCIALLLSLLVSVFIALIIAAGVVHSHRMEKKAMEKLLQQLIGNETDSGLRGPADGEGVVVVILPESTATEAATTTAVPFTA